MKVSPDSLFILPTYHCCYCHSQCRAGALFVGLLASYWAELAVLCCTLQVGSEPLCPTRGWPGAVLWKESLYNKHLWAAGFPHYLPLLCTHKRPQDTSLITVIVQALRVLRVLLSQTFRTYAFLNWKHYSYLCLSNTVFVQSSQKNRHTSMNFRSMKWLFSCIWNIFQFQAWFSN